MTPLARQLIAWQKRRGRHDLPWQHRPTAYRVWVSEIMLQQTQAETVAPYFRRFMKRFPSLKTLADAPTDEVLHLWSGLGYYARARQLHRTAQIVSRQHRGRFPRRADELIQLPGIGRSTAGAILSLAYDLPQPILDGNAKRVLARYHAVSGWPGHGATQRELWALAERHIPDHDVRVYTQAIMDLGATVCKPRNPCCGECPLAADCAAFLGGAPDAFPGRRPQRTTRRRDLTMLLIVAPDDAVLLRRRPPAGIWGGLWGFPELDAKETATAWCARHGLITRGPVSRWAKIKHLLTHLELKITPVLVPVVNREVSGRMVADDSSWLWYGPEHAAAVGLAAPVQTLIKRVHGKDAA